MSRTSFSVRSRRIAAAAALAVATTGIGTLFAGAASAHVTVNPREATQGGYEKLVFRVPNESEEAGTVKLVVNFPQDTPFSSARVKPHAGWDAEIEYVDLDPPVTLGDRTIDRAVASITWTAEDGTRIGPGEFDEFEISVGPLPSVDSIPFPAIQTYDDGSEAAWVEMAEEGAEEPERPAPVLALKAGDSGHGASSDDVETPAAEPAANVTDDDASAAPAGESSDGTARGLAVAGLVVGVIGLGVGVAAVSRSRRRPTS